MSDVNLSQIHPYAFAHPADRKATDRLKMTPFLPDLLQKIAEINVEEKMWAHFMYNSIRVHGQQLMPISNMVGRVAAKMGMEAPEIFVSSQGGVNAFACGLKRKFIVLTTELIEIMDRHELEAVIAHEMAHILCDHLLYRTVAIAVASPMVPLASNLPGRLVRDSLSGVLYRWYRCAELTADRASLLVVGDSKIVISVLAKLSGVPQKYRDSFELDLFKHQARSYEEASSFWSKVITKGMGLFLSHPEPVRRAVEIAKWEKSDQYKAILSGNFLSRTDYLARSRIRIKGMRSCPVCNFANNPEDSRCQDCSLDLNPERQVFCSNGHLNSVDWRFCHACRENLGDIDEPEVGSDSVA